MGFTSDANSSLCGGRIFICLLAAAGWNYSRLAELWSPVWLCVTGGKGPSLYQEAAAQLSGAKGEDRQPSQAGALDSIVPLIKHSIRNGGNIFTFATNILGFVELCIRSSNQKRLHPPATKRKGDHYELVCTPASVAYLNNRWLVRCKTRRVLRCWHPIPAIFGGQHLSGPGNQGVQIQFTQCRLSKSFKAGLCRSFKSSLLT